jgi:hypothetical protein
MIQITPNVIASDTHLGSFLVYSAFRLLGHGRETAFQLWAVSIFTLNYFVTWIVLPKAEVSFGWKYLPGASGIRAVTRCMLVGIYPLAFVFGALLSFLLTNQIRIGIGWSNQFIGLGILALTLADQAAKVSSVEGVRSVGAVKWC